MALLKRALDNRFNDHNSSTIPKAPRSVRRRRSNHKSPQSGGICAFDLLAIIAGKILEESECSSASSSAGAGFDLCRSDKDSIKKEHTPTFTSSDCPMKLDFDSKSLVHKNPCEFVEHYGIREKSTPKCGEADDTNVGKGNNKFDLPLFRDSNPDSTFRKLDSNVNVGYKDDDESVSLDFKPTQKVKVYNSKTHTEDQNMRKLMTSNMWSTAPKLKDYEKCDTGGAGVVGPVNNNKRYPYEIDRSQRNTPFKKRKFLDRSSVVTYDGGISCESVSNSPKNSTEIERKLHEGKGMSSSAFGRQKSCSSKISDVRLRIKSFKVPELFIEVPKSTTVCSLKKTVLEAVTTILGGGLHVGVLLHGKNIQDDDQTLLQTGISQNNNNIDNISFMLEPDGPTQPSQFKCSQDPNVPLSLNSPKFVNRSLDNTNKDIFPEKLVREKPLMTNSNFPDGYRGDIVPSHSDSKALVPVTKASTETLALLPGNGRLKRCEIGQRRARRPFSVSEVEALVQAVEKLGTGRWRDVKLCAFENARHRTYVDLKDKWKTLVHTARISPQQRRGEPVPQELLDRVLTAQAYWFNHPSKQHGKQQHAIVVPKLTDCAFVKA